MSAPQRDSAIDRVDELDRPIGTVKRGQVLQLGANFRTSHVFVFTQDGGSLLLQRLAPTRERHPNRWGSSVAAYLHAGESYDEAAERRLTEELGFSAPLRFVGRTRMRDDQSWKFVALYRAIDGRAHIQEPDHIAELKPWPLADLARTVQRSPDLFTPTFLHLYSSLPWQPQTAI